MQKIKKFAVVLVVMLILSVPFFTLSVAAFTKSDIPLDILINPRALGVEGLDNFFYIEYSFLTSSGEMVHGGRYYCFSKPDVVVDIKSQGTSYGFFINLFSTTTQVSVRLRYVDGVKQTAFSEGDVGVSNAISVSTQLTWSDLSTENFFVTKLVYGGDISINRDGSPLRQIGAPELPDLMSTLQNGVTILQPQNGFKQSQIELVTMQYAFKVPHRAGATKDDIKIKVDGYIKDGAYPPEVEHAEYKEQGGYAYGLYKVNGSVGFGEGKELKVTVTDSYGNNWFDTVTISNFSDFVDEDGDGADDRAGDDYWDYSPIGYNKPDVKMQDLGNMLSGVKGFFESLWGILPTPVYVFLVGAIILLLAVGTLRAVLG